MLPLPHLKISKPSVNNFFSLKMQNKKVQNCPDTNPCFLWSLMHICTYVKYLLLESSGDFCYINLKLLGYRNTSSENSVLDGGKIGKN